jgi:hypothetical protein
MDSMGDRLRADGVDEYLLQPRLHLNRSCNDQSNRSTKDQHPMFAIVSPDRLELPLPAITAECLRIAYEQNTSAAIRHLRASL